jgi:hypothetical protein
MLRESWFTAKLALGVGGLLIAFRQKRLASLLFIFGKLISCGSGEGRKANGENR